MWYSPFFHAIFDVAILFVEMFDIRKNYRCLIFSAIFIRHSIYLVFLLRYSIFEKPPILPDFESVEKHIAVVKNKSKTFNLQKKSGKLTFSRIKRSFIAFANAVCKSLCNCHSIFLHLRKTQEALQLPFQFFFSFYFSSLFLDRLPKVIFKFFSDCCFKRMWPRSKYLIRYAVSFQAMSFKEKQKWQIEAIASGIFLFSN